MDKKKNNLVRNLKRFKGENKIEKMYLFGSMATAKSHKYSDVDLIVEFNVGQKNFRNFMGTASFTEDLLGRKVDLLTPQSLSPYIAPHIEKNIEYVQIS